MRLTLAWFYLFSFAFPLPGRASTLPGSPAPTTSPIALAASSSSCTASACAVTEGDVLILTYAAVAGDVILLDPDGSISDVVRFFNNIVDTGGGTGIGSLVSMFSKVDTGPDLSVGVDLGLPSGSTFSENSVRIPEAPDGAPTIYNGNGRTYLFYSDTPEPSALWYATLGLLGGFFRWRLGRGLRRVRG